MYNFLIVEDQESKYIEIAEVFNVFNVNITWANNLEKADHEIAINNFDLIILDITLSESRSNNFHYELDGYSVIGTIENENMSPTIVVTQYNNFENGELYKSNQEPVLVNNHYDDYNYYMQPAHYESNKNIHLLSSLHDFFCSRFHFYVGAVRYRYDSDEWKDYLKELIHKVKELEYEDIIA